MNNKIFIDYRRKANFFKVFAHPTRLLIVDKLLKSEMCVANIEQMLGLKQANVSQHLNILRTYGIVDYKIEGKNRCYYLKEPKMISKILEHVIERSRI